MDEIDISLNMADSTPHFWNDYWSNPMGKSKKDPTNDVLRTFVCGSLSALAGLFSSFSFHFSCAGLDAVPFVSFSS